MIISSTTISPLSLKRSGVGVPPLISTMKHEWYFNNVQNASGNIITIPDTGSVGGLDIANPALANKPTQSSIGTKISYAADGVDDYLYKATTNFMKSMPTWMITVVFKYDSSSLNRFLNIFNETNTKREGVNIAINHSTSNFVVSAFNSSGGQTVIVNKNESFVNGTNYIYTIAWGGTNISLYRETTNKLESVSANPFSIPTQTDNVSVFGEIKPASSNLFGKGSVGYIGVDEFDLTRLNANVATLKTTFGI